MQSNRSWREWARRWGMGGLTGAFEIHPNVQPVVVVDDVSVLALPPVVQAFLGTGSPGAVAAQYTTHVLAPTSLPVIVDRVTAATGNAHIGVDDGAPPSLATAAVGTRVQGWPGSPGPTCAYSYGTTATDLSDTVGAGHIPTSVWNDLGLLVLPGQFFWIQLGTVNAVMEARLLWFEIPVDGDAWFTSLPRS